MIKVSKFQKKVWVTYINFKIFNESFRDLRHAETDGETSGCMNCFQLCWKQLNVCTTCFKIAFFSVHVSKYLKLSRKEKQCWIFLTDCFLINFLSFLDSYFENLYFDFVIQWELFLTLKKVSHVHGKRIVKEFTFNGY